MAVLKIKKSSRFSTYENELVQTNKISFKSRGFLVYLLSLPENWEVSIPYLCKYYREGKDFFYGCIDKLKKAGYITHVRHRDEKGKITKGEYIVRESPHTENSEEVENRVEQPQSDFPHPAHRPSGFPRKENSDDINKYKDTKETKKTKETAAAKDAVVLSSKDASLLAAAPLELIENGKLNPEQKCIVEQTVKGLCDDSVSLEPVRLTADVITVLEDSRAFTLSGNLFYKKLNTVKKQIQSGMWQSPLASAAIVSSAQKIISPIDADLKKLNAQIADLERQKQSFERGVCDERFKHQPEYLASCKKMVVALDAEIESLMRAKDRMKSESGKTTAQQGECHATSH